jgi:hypothetical protein
MPIVRVAKSEVVELGAGVRALDVVFENTRVIPTRTARAASMKIGQPDLFTIEPVAGAAVQVLAGGVRSDRFRAERIELAEREPARLLSERGIPGRSEVRVRWFVRGAGRVKVAWQGDKARAASAVVDVR